MRRSAHQLLLCSLAGGVFTAADPAMAQSITFRKVADTETPIPGGVGDFTGFVSNPCLDGGNVVFGGRGDFDQHGLYTDLGGTLRVVADLNTPAPGGTEPFISAFEPSIDSGSVAFRGAVRRDGTTSEGVFLETAGTITLVADTNTPVPGGEGTFTYFAPSAVSTPSLDSGNVAFAAGSSLGPHGGIYVMMGGTLQKVADANTPVPGGSGTFQALGFASLSGANVAFLGSEGGFGTGHRGLYADTGGILSAVVDANTPIPGGTGNFTAFGGGAVVDGVDFAFLGRGSDDQSGYYAVFDGTCSVVADRNMIGLPVGPHPPSLESRNVMVDFSPGIVYVHTGGSLLRVIGDTDSLDGKIISLAYAGREALSGNEIAFFAIFTDGSEGIYVANVLPFCGNGTVEEGEECDDGGESAACDTDCTLALCDDGVLNHSAGEECDRDLGDCPYGCAPDCLCARPPAVPMLPTLGLIGTGLLLLIGGAIVFRRRGAATTSSPSGPKSG